MHKSQDGDGETIKADSNLKPSTITAGQNKNSIDHFYKDQWTRKYNNYSKENTENKDRWLEMSNLNLIPFPHKVTIKAIKVSVQFIKDASSDTYFFFFSAACSWNPSTAQPISTGKMQESHPALGQFSNTASTLTQIPSRTTNSKGLI